MQQLQAALDRSLEAASTFTRSLFAEDSWDAARVSEPVNTQRNLTVATTSATGGPHAAVVIVACLAGDVHFTVAPESALGRNLERDDRVAFTVCAATHAVMGRGTAVLVARALDAPELIDLLAEAAAAGRFTPSGWDGLIDRIELERVFAN